MMCDSLWTVHQTLHGAPRGAILIKSTANDLCGMRSWTCLVRSSISMIETWCPWTCRRISSRRIPWPGERTVKQVAQGGLQLPPISSILPKSTANDPCVRSNPKWTPLSLLARIGSLLTLWSPPWMACLTYSFMVTRLQRLVTTSSCWWMVVGNLTPPSLVWMLFCVSMVALVSVSSNRTSLGSLAWRMLKVRISKFLSFLGCVWTEEIPKY